MSAVWSAAWAVDSQTDTAAPVAPQPALVAGTDQAFNAGDIAATAFAGSKLIVDSLPPGVDPVSKTFIDPEGIVLRIFSVPNLGDPKTQQMLNAPAIYQAQARDVGHLFGLAFDNLEANGPATPGLYAAATSSFGLQIVGPDRDGDGQPDRLTKGSAGATFMSGQFGNLPGAGPGTIYKIDQATGNIVVFANVTTNGVANSGPGIGGLAFDPGSRAIFASDLDTGLIHAFASDGSDIAQFDHGVSGRPLNKQDAVADDGKRMDITSDAFDPSKPATWGFTQNARRIDALAVYDARLYYAVAEGPQIWSVGIDSSGKFGSDPRPEIAVAAERPFPITGIVFDADGRVIITQRGTVENPADYSHFTEQGPAQTLRFTAENPDDPNTPDRWKRDAEEYAVGNSKDNRASSGGLALQYTYKDDGSIDFASCGGTIIVSADALGAKSDGHGLQLNAIGLVRPANVPPTQSTFIDLTAGENDPETRGYAGGVAALQNCGGSEFPPVAGGAGGFPPVEGGGVPPVGGGGTAFPPVVGGDLVGGGATTDEGTEGGGGTTTNGQLDLSKVPGSTTCTENQSCAFNITVKNGSDKPADTVVISDNPSIGGVPFTKFKLGDVAAPWVCTASAAPGLQCTHPALQPGESADLTLGFTPDPGSLGAATAFDNCASFAGAGAPAANNPQPQAALPPPPAPTSTNNGGLKVETLGTTPTCSPATGTCEFEIKITNNTGQPITDQPLKISNTLTVGTQTQAKNNAASMQLPAGLQCQPTGREFNCSQNALTLAPNQSVSLKVAFSVDTTEGGQANFVQNKTNVTLGPLAGEATGAIGIVDDKKLPEPDANGQQAGGAGGQPATPACASIPITPPGPIITNKKGPTKCAPKGTCAFSIDVTNNSAAPVPGPIEIVDTIDLPGTTIAGAVAAPFACDPGGPPFKCRLNATLQPKETKTLSLNLNFDAPAGTKSVKNCATPTQPAAAPGGAGQAPAPDQGQQQKQFAPGKKSELFPFGRTPLRRFASFRPQSFAPPARLFHLAGGAGGNIGGIGANNCLKWGMDKGGFRVVQSNGPTVGFSDIKVAANGTVTGTASFIANEGGPGGLGGPVSGKVEGNITGSHVDLLVTWNTGVRTGHYVGEIAPDGSFSGTNAAANGVRATFKSDKIWFQCALDDLCKKYADDAMAAEAEFASLHCGAVGSGRWSDKIDDHITWCMAQSRGGDSPIQSETDARTKSLDSCRAFDARCTKAGLAVAAANDEMKALKCADAIPSLQPDKAKSACKTLAIKLTPEALAESAQQKLAACKAALAANGGPGNPGGAVDPGGAADGQGGGGQVQPPANQCVTLELDPNTPPNPQPAPNQLTLAKNPVAAQCSATGGGCAFTISVSNPANAPEFNGPIKITDHISAPDGSTFPNVTMLTPVNTTGDEGVVGDIGCLKNGSDVTCTSASVKIPPGKGLQIPMTFKPGDGSAAKAIKNCASFEGGENQCATIPLTDGPLLRANKLTAFKTCVPECVFAISLTNVGNSDAPGPFSISEDFTPMGPNVKISEVDGDFACVQIGMKVGCISTNKKTDVLHPGETTNGTIKVTGADLSPEYKNCVGYDPKAQAKPSPFDNEWPGRCVTIKEANPMRGKLELFKAVRNEPCKIGGTCAYDVIVTNVGFEYSGPIEILDEIPEVNSLGKQQPQPAGVEPFANNDWTCQKLDPRRMSCSATKQSLAGGGANVTLPVLVTPGPGWKKNDVVENCATLKAAPGTIGDGQRACAQYTLDPFNVAISKTGDQSCAPGGDCHFTLNLFNPGPIDHNAPVTISDHLKGLSSAQILSIKPPLPCASQPTQIPFSCTSPDNVCLDLNGKAGEKCGPQTFEMVVRLPNDASAQQFSNCASVTKGEKHRSDEESCHIVSLKPVATQTPPPATEPTRTTPPAPPGDNCTRGMVLTADGCRCPPGTEFNGRRCWSDSGSGHAYPVQPGVEVPPPPPGCFGGRIVIGGACRCPPGTRFDGKRCLPIGDGHAYPAQPNPEVPQTPPTTQRPPPVQTSPPQCPEHSMFRRNRCVCLPGYQPIGRRCERVQQPDGGTRETQPGNEKCQPGQNRDPRTGICFSCSHNDHFENGRCVPNTRPVVCRSGTHLENGICVPNEKPETRHCPAGYKVLDKPNKYGAYCEPPTPTAPCPPSAPEGTPPNCHCPAGTVTREGFCRPISCPPGWIGRPPHCRQPKPTPKPTPTPTPTGPTPKPVPQKPKCSGDKIPSTSGQCVCPSGTRDVGHNQCGSVVK